jgi:uncharacterized protein (DUF2249 family)/hemerythrin superfamily protein
MPVTASSDLDVRTVPVPGRDSTVFARFDALSPDEAFVLLNDHDLTAVLRQFQIERPGRFDWNVLESGPEHFRVEIRRRIAVGPRSVNEYLGGDHRRLDQALADVMQFFDARNWRLARERFSEFTCGLNRHIDAEERVLFPRYEELDRANRGPTRVMRAEHIAIRELMDEVESALLAEDDKRASQWLQALAGDLESHNVKEESVLYPAVDQGVGSEDELDNLVKAMQVC